MFPLKKPFPHIFLWFALKILETLGLRTWPGLGTRWDRGPPGTAPQRQEHWGSLEPTATKVCSYSKGLPVVFVLQYNPIHLFCLLFFLFLQTNKHTYIHALHCIALHCTALHYIITFHYIKLHYIKLHYIYITLNYIALHCITLHCTALHYTTLHYYITLH